MQNKTALFGQRNMAAGAFEFYLVEQRPDGKRFIGANVTMEEHNPMLRFGSPTFTIPFEDKEALQNLADELGMMGFLPRAAQAQQGELGAVRYHLEDMRKLAKVK